MIELQNTNVHGFEAAIRGARNPMNSWDRSDSHFGMTGDEWSYDPGFVIGQNDYKLLLDLAKAGSSHSKYRRMILVSVDVTAPLYWWKEADTYKVGTVRNSCSTMHKIHAKEFTIGDFSCEHLITSEEVEMMENTSDFEEGCYMLLSEVNHDSSVELGDYPDPILYPMDIMKAVIDMLNVCRAEYQRTRDKRYWWQLIQLLPSSYNQRATLLLNYEVLSAMYHDRRNHKLDEWHDFCAWVESLPYSRIITLKDQEV